MRFQQLYYVLDSDLRILWIGGEWDEFALANGGSAALSNQILSTPLASHIVDDETRLAIADLVASVQAVQEPLRLDYRCDSPTLARRYLMTIQPMKDGRVLMVHDLRDAHTFPRPLHPWKYRAEAKARKCSFCCAVSLDAGRDGQDGQTWVAAEALEVDHPAEVRFTLCPSCMARTHDAVQSLHARRATSHPAAGSFGPTEHGSVLWSPRLPGDAEPQDR